jgi:hypothetical protein
MLVPNLSAASRTSRLTSFRFGEESRVTVITPVRLHYLLMPFRFYRCFHGRNIFGGGITIGYLLNTEADVTSYDERPDGKYNYETVRQSGYKDGFSWYDSQLTAFYRKDLCRSFGIHAEAFFGLTDIKNDQFFRQSNKETNSGLKLSLIYYPLNTSLK